jgi:hypothetical protein
MPKEFGLFGVGGVFKNDQEIKRDLAKRNELPECGMPQKDLDHWISKAKRRAEDINEDTSVLDTLLNIGLKPNTILCLISDIHFGHPKVDYGRVRQEVQVIKNSPNTRVAFMGDLVDGMFWGATAQSEQSATLEEQFKFIKLLFDELGPKVLFTCSGEHDSKWASKTGIDPYCFMAPNIPYVRGVAEVKFKVGEQEYNGVFSHKLRGSSIYNASHPEMRASRETQGADLYVGGHTHNKGLAQQPVRRFGGSSLVSFISLGPYKSGDEYSQRSGWVKQNPDQLYGCAVMMDSKEHRIDIEPDIIKAHRRWA